MAWRTDEFGECHEGIVGAVLADGTEPRPVYLDIGSGGSMHETREWWAYDGSLGRPKAAAYRAACACGWRGESYPIDWDRMDEDRLVDLDTSDPYDDWWEHISVVERRTVPLPDGLTELIDQVEEQLTALADRAPVAALKAAAALERITDAVSREAAYAARADDLPWESIGRGLGLSADKARARVLRYSLPY